MKIVKTMRISKMLAIVAAVAMGMAAIGPAFLSNAQAALSTN